MTPELKAKWLEALRGGKYKQTTGVLKNDDGFCCLGVLCDVMDPNAWTGELKPSEYNTNEEPVGYAYKFPNDQEGVDNIPTELAEQLGLHGLMEVTRDDPDFNGNDGKYTYHDSVVSILVDSNDSYGQTFAQIADYIEANL